jgi:hypothetical protein
MSSPGKQPFESTDFLEAVAQWRLELRTEVKRSSSLPTAMFDACDPMLETSLAATTEAMLARLQQPGPEVAKTEAAGEMRVELVTSDELSQLPRHLVGNLSTAADLEAALDTEFLGVLTDTCATATGAGQEHAIRLMAAEFRLEPHEDLDHATTRLWEQVRGAVTDETSAGFNAVAVEKLCRQVVRTVANGVVQTREERPR